jgi:hypothetical protein
VGIVRVDVHVVLELASGRAAKCVVVGHVVEGARRQEGYMVRLAKKTCFANTALSIGVDRDVVVDAPPALGGDEGLSRN